jgi:hypothetical protein
MPHLAIGFFFLRRNKYKIAKVRYFTGEKLYIKAFSSFFLIINISLSLHCSAQRSISWPQRCEGFFSIFVLIPISYVRSIVPPPPTVSRKQNMAGKGQYFFGSRAWDTQWVCNMGWLNVG